MNVAIITAMPEESGAILKCAVSYNRDKIGRFKTFSFNKNGACCTIVLSGVGFENAKEVASLLISEKKPDMLLSAGFCGAIDPKLQVGDIVYASEIFLYENEFLKQIPQFKSAISDFSDRLNKSEILCYESAFITVKKSIRKDILSKKIGATVEFPVIEMESYAVAEAASENGIPFFSLRTVSDARDEELLFSTDDICGRDGNLSITKTVASIIKKPALIPQFIRLAKNSKVAAIALRKAFEAIL